MISGGCLCGAVRFDVEGTLSGIWFCHCSKCRRASGSAFQPACVCERDAFRWIGSAATLSEFRMSPGYRRAFCARCGSPAPLMLEHAPLVWLPAGAFDGDPGIRPTHHIFVGSKAPWFEITDALPQYDAHAPTKASS